MTVRPRPPEPPAPSLPKEEAPTENRRLEGIGLGPFVVSGRSFLALFFCPPPPKIGFVQNRFLQGQPTGARAAQLGGGWAPRAGRASVASFRLIGLILFDLMLVFVAISYVPR